MNYAVAPATPAAANGGTTVGTAPNTVAVQAGPASGVTLSASSVSWPVGTAVTASASGANNPKSITANVDMTKFTNPGVYRYALTETVGTNTSNLSASGSTKWIDVYIKRGTDGLECAGMVMHGSNASDKAALSNITFETVNITLKKVISGDMADMTHQFPFSGKVTDGGRYFYAKKGSAPTAANADKKAGAAGGTSISTTLTNNEMYYISGLTHEAAVTYTETNNTSDAYSVAITGGTPSAASTVAAGGTKAMASTDVDNAGAVVFTNTLTSVSPTGVVMRFGLPLFAIAMALFLAKANKESKSTR